MQCFFLFVVVLKLFCGSVSYAKAPMFLQLFQLCEAAFSGTLLGLDFMTAFSILCVTGVHPTLHLDSQHMANGNSDGKAGRL